LYTADELQKIAYLLKEIEKVKNVLVIIELIRLFTVHSNRSTDFLYSYSYKCGLR